MEENELIQLKRYEILIRYGTDELEKIFNSTELKEIINRCYDIISNNEASPEQAPGYPKNFLPYSNKANCGSL
jgi:hypothetical protein